MDREYSNLEKVRLEKVDQLREQGIDPYPAHSERSHTNQEVIQAFEDNESSGVDQSVEATLVGRIRSVRPMGKITFAHIEDGTGRVQLFLRQMTLDRNSWSYSVDISTWAILFKPMGRCSAPALVRFRCE